MSAFTPGEHVDITIRGARVSERHVQDKYLYLVEPGDGGRDFYLRLPLPDGVTVERVAPAEWPPRPGDVWRGNGSLFFAVAYMPNYDDHADADGIDVEGMRVVLSRDFQDYSEHLGTSHCRPETILRNFGPLTLEYRRPTNGGAPDA